MDRIPNKRLAQRPELETITYSSPRLGRVRLRCNRADITAHTYRPPMTWDQLLEDPIMRHLPVCPCLPYNHSHIKSLHLVATRVR
ncbi:MAG: hypothetical protein OXI12_01740 [Gammaproteobacteria bacterium]|nr:hypothetical protein [Gammaproteobacteria bacterium]